MSRFERVIVILGSLIVLGGLALFAYVGTFTRYWADDYCYSAFIRMYGWWDGIAQWYISAGNRFSSIATVAVIDIFGPKHIAFLPLILLAFWVFAWVYFLDRLFKSLLRWQINRLWLAYFGLWQVFFVVLLAPDRLQTIYWRMATMHYAFPLPLLLILLGWTVGHFNHSGWHWTLLASVVLAFYAAGHGETYAMLQVGVLGLGLMAALIFYKDARRNRAAVWIGAPLISSIVATILLFLSPYMANRVAAMPLPTDLWLVAPYTLRYVSDFIFYSVRGQITPFAVYFLGVAATSLAAIHLKDPWPGSTAPPVRISILGMILSLAVTYILIALTFIPSAFGNLQYPAPRALMPANFTLLVGLAGFSFFLSGVVIHLRLPVRRAQLRLLVLLALLGLSLYPLRVARIPLQELRQQSVRAARWDARDAQIRQAIAAGERDVVVNQVEVVQTLEDMGPDARHWINICASIYYGARSIIANP